MALGGGVPTRLGARNPRARSPSPSPSPICRGSGMGIPSPVCWGSGIIPIPGSHRSSVPWSRVGLRLPTIVLGAGPDPEVRDSPNCRFGHSAGGNGRDFAVTSLQVADSRSRRSDVPAESVLTCLAINGFVSAQVCASVFDMGGTLLLRNYEQDKRTSPGPSAPSGGSGNISGRPRQHFRNAECRADGSTR
jgi:hypothetical protein